ncbi:site-specific DNA-methyltransferase [Mogibacterium neglectum]|uniref:site-specific DNA-methyltransferase n=1 Tax=Mogibacterium neglectum TaxID=114528 RepID=UPI00272996C6|nr:site-specific DNA-methyltransferase [Mogibacterium neglectum]WLD76506.1 site-specific DNA-methyltransferase [Mogibacterium neglectum]
MDEQLTFEFEQRPTIKGFPELRWTGKRPYRSSQYYPAQLRESYGDAQDGWINKIFWGDNLQVMSHMLKDYRGQIDLIYIDPPFDSKADYKKKISVRGLGSAETDSTSFEEKQYGDIWSNDEYLQFMYERLTIMYQLLSEKGAIYIHCDWHKSAQLRCLCDPIFGPENFRNEIVWCYRTSLRSSSHAFGRDHDTILFYAKSDAHKIHPDRKDFPVSEATIKRWAAYADENGFVSNKHFAGSSSTIIDTSDESKGFYINQGIPRDWWEVSANVAKGNTLEVVAGKYPTQKPEALIERIIKASSDPGDLVFDCFMGSGTTQAVAMKLGRRFIGADINLGAIQTTTKRLLSIAAELKPTHKPVTYEMIQPQLSMVAEEPAPYLAAASAGGNTELSAEDRGKVIDFFKAKGLDTTALEEGVKYTGFEVYNVNNYDFFRNPVEARDLLIAALEIQPFPQSDVWNGELDGRMVKIMPVNRIATKADLKELLANLPYKTYEKRKEENPNQPVERITIVCMGHEPDLKGALEQELNEYKVDIQIMDILRDKADLQLKRDSEAEIVREGGKLVIRAFYPMNLMQKLSLQKEYVEDWSQLVDSIMIDWNYDGVVMQPTVTDVPGKNEIVKGIYDIPEGCGTIKVKITDLLSESLEVEVH